MHREMIYPHWRFIVWLETQCLSYEEIDRAVKDGKIHCGDSSQSVLSAIRGDDFDRLISVVELLKKAIKIFQLYGQIDFYIEENKLIAIHRASLPITGGALAALASYGWHYDAIGERWVCDAIGPRRKEP
jgi:hypothetical protein